MSVRKHGVGRAALGWVSGDQLRDGPERSGWQQPLVPGVQVAMGRTGVEAGSWLAG